MSNVYQWGDPTNNQYMPNSIQQDPMQLPDYVAPKCVIGLDRDGVINVDRGEYTYSINDFKRMN